jgi:predicted HicB family RNase H-like nuclease
MDNIMKHKEYIGSIKVSPEDNLIHGKIEFINDLVTFEAATVPELKQAFIEAVEDYIELCAEVGKEPEKSFTGSFNVRIGPDLHRKAAIVSLGKQMSLNQLVQEAVSHYIDSNKLIMS